MLKAGFSRVDITPPFGTPLAGYYEMRYADGVRDPVQLNALAMNDGERTVVLITADVLLIRLTVCDELRALINERTGIGAENVMITGLHPHTSMRIGGEGGSVVRDRNYLDVLYRKFADVAQMAIDDMAEATFGTAVTPTAEPISFVRRYYLKDGRLKTNPGGHTPDEIAGPAAEADNNVRLIRFVREGKKDIALVNFCTHPDVIGGTKISADWPGFVRRFVEAEHDTHCIFVNGFQGDTNHINFMVPKEERRKGRVYAYGDKGYAHSEYMGRTIADAVNVIWDKTERATEDKLHTEMRLVYIKTSTRGMEHFAECSAFNARYRAGDYSVKKTESGIELAEACRIAAIPEQPTYQRIPITVIGLGKIAFFGLGGEPFTAYAFAARKAAPDKFIVTACCANGGEAYLPTKQAFDQGGYEVISSHFSPDLEEKIMKDAAEMLNNF